MSGLISSLHNSSGALRVHSKGLETVGKNLANINNPAYAKQRVAIGDRGQINTGIATEMMGVEAMALRQNRDSMLDRGVMRELNATSALQASKQVLQSAETAMGQFLDRTEDGTSIQNVSGATGGGISDALTDFFNAWESFSVKPNDIAEKQLLIAKAEILADKFNATDKRLNQVQLDVDQQIQTDLIVVNDILKEIAKINDYIAKAENVKPFSAVDLRDQRQAKLEELSKYVDVTFAPMDPDFKKSLGRVDVFLNNGQNPPVKLVDGSAVTSAGDFQYNATNRLLSWSGAPNSTIPNGSLVARLEASTQAIATTRGSIGDLAVQLVEQVNAVYQDDVFKLAKTNGIIDMSYNKALTLEAGEGGGNRIALAVAELGTKIFAPSEFPLFDSNEPHGLTNGDKIYRTEQGLMWVANGIDPAKLGVTADTPRYTVEVGSDKSFQLKNANGDFVDGLVATSPITKVTKYEETNAVSQIGAVINPFVSEFSFPGVAFADGNKVQFLNLPPGTPDSILDSKLVYTLKTNPNGTFRFEKPDGTPLQITQNDIFGVDGSAKPIIREVPQAAGNAPTTVEAVTFGNPPEFYGDFSLGDADSFIDGDKVQFTGVGAPLNDVDIYTISALTVDPITGVILQNGAANGIKVVNFNDLNGNPIAGVTQATFAAASRVVRLTEPAAPKASPITAGDVVSNPNDGRFLGQFTLTAPAGFGVGNQVQFTNLPAGSALSPNETYTISDLITVPGRGVVFNLKNAQGQSLSLARTDIGPTTSIARSQIDTEGSFLSFRQRNFEGSFAGNFNSIVTVLAQTLNTTNIRLEDQQLSEKMAVETRDQYSGVSQDEEVTDMMKFQRSFQASARHINIIDTLLDQVVNRLGVG